MKMVFLFIKRIQIQTENSFLDISYIFSELEDVLEFVPRNIGYSITNIQLVIPFGVH